MYLAGAWAGYGFHEDGLKAGIAAAQALGASVPWTPRAASPKVRWHLIFTCDDTFSCAIYATSSAALQAAGVAFAGRLRLAASSLHGPSCRLPCCCLPPNPRIRATSR